MLFRSGVFAKCATKFTLVQVVNVAGAVEVLEFARVGEVVDDEYVTDSVGVELVDEVAADEACSAGDDVHGSILFPGPKPGLWLQRAKKFGISDEFYCRRSELPVIRIQKRGRTRAI